MKVNELVWKKMSLCESESKFSFVDQVGQISSGECKANNLNSASSRYFECTVFTVLHHCIEHALVRVFGLATSAGTTSSCTRRWRNSSSIPTPTTIFRKITWKVKCFKGAERREPDFQQQGDPSHIFFYIHHLQLRFSGSAHVQHLRKHPKKYEAAVVEFLKRTMSVVEEEEEVGSWIAWLNLGISTKIG